MSGNLKPRNRIVGAIIDHGAFRLLKEMDGYNSFIAQKGQIDGEYFITMKIGERKLTQGILLTKTPTDMEIRNAVGFVLNCFYRVFNERMTPVAQ